MPKFIVMVAIAVTRDSHKDAAAELFKRLNDPKYQPTYSVKLASPPENGGPNPTVKFSELEISEGLSVEDQAEFDKQVQESIEYMRSVRESDEESE